MSDLYCIIMQGASGSGKTTVANRLAVTYNALRCSTDDLRMEDGKYVFRAEDNRRMHEMNQRRVGEFLASGRSVIVDNTNIRAWEAKPYVLLSMKYNAQIIFIRCTGEFSNQHGVPEERVEEMRGEMEELSIKKCLIA